MKLRNFLFGRGFSRGRSVPTMNMPRSQAGQSGSMPNGTTQSRERYNAEGERWEGNPPDGAEWGQGQAMPPKSPCNPPDRRGSSRRSQSGSDAGACEEPYSPYGKLLPDAESYTRNISDRGNDPYIFNFGKIAKEEGLFRNALWTGENMQIISMAVPSGQQIPAELHNDTDQLLIIFGGEGELLIGRSENRLSPFGKLSSGSAAIIPSGLWHKVKNTSSSPLKLISIYSPPHHPYGTMQKTNPEN